MLEQVSCSVVVVVSQTMIEMILGVRPKMNAILHGANFGLVLCFKFKCLCFI